MQTVFVFADTKIELFLIFSLDKQNELELPCPVPKSRERKRRQAHQGQPQHQQQQQQGGTMTQISGVRKVSQTPSISGCSVNRFGVKTDQEELLSKVSNGQKAENGWVSGVIWVNTSTYIILCVLLTPLIGPGEHQ